MASSANKDAMATAEDAQAAAVPAREGGLSFDFSRYGILIVFALVIALAQLIYPSFLSWTNIRIILAQNAPLGIIAVGMTYVMIAGGFDLSVGAIYAFGATMFAKVSIASGMAVGGLSAMVLGLVCGTLNGVLVARLKISPFIATLGSASVLSGLAYVYSESRPHSPSDPSFMILGQGFWGPLPISVWLLFAVVLVAGFVLARTVYGQSLYAVGGNENAAALSGLRVGLLRGSTYAFLGVMSALAGMIEASRLAVGQADIGANMPLDAISVVIIGGTSLFGGEGAIWRTVVGLLILGAITNLFYSLAIDSNVQLVAKGIIVIGAVAIDVWSRSR